MSELRGIAMFFLALSLVVLSVRANVVSFIDPCPIDDNDCILTSARKAMPFIVEGIPSLGVPAADPLVLNDVVTNNQDMNIRFRNMTVKGPSKCKLVEVERSEQHKAKVVLECPVVATGLYVMKGNIAGITVEGDSDFKIETGNIRITVVIDLETYIGKDGEEHYKIKKFDYKYEPVEKFDLVFNNLFGGNKEKAKPVEDIIKVTGNELVAALGKPVIVELIKKAVHIIDKFFSAVPCKELEKR